MSAIESSTRAIRARRSAPSNAVSATAGGRQPRVGRDGVVFHVDHDGPTRLAQMVQAVIHLDPLQPAPELRTSLEFLKGEIRLHEHLLRQILGVVAGSGQEPAIADHELLVTADKRVEGPGVGRSVCLQQLD